MFELVQTMVPIYMYITILLLEKLGTKKSTASPAPPIPLPKRSMLLSFDQALVCGATRNTAGGFFFW